MVERVATYLVMLLNRFTMKSSSPFSVWQMRRLGLAPQQQFECLAEQQNLAGLHEFS
jgi:hypothetical protein